MMMKSSLQKVAVVVRVALKDAQFGQHLSADPATALREKGFDLSPVELLTVVDIVCGSQNSPLSGRIDALRTEWSSR